ncbi:MAG: hypothetical protein C4K58_06570 [Flavobacteriaceae bacterium]|nr:MAG: hypothetical protein C4K58_06570 [Flavobacteriaceae bacterium]
MGLLDISPKSIVLCNGTVHIELAKLRLMQKLMRNKTIGPILARLSPKWSFKATMRNIWSDAKKLKESDLDSMWELMKKEEGLLVMPMISQFTRDRSRYWHRWVGALQNTKIPLAFLWGTEDPIATLEIARVHHNESKGSRLVLLENTGHYPMIESPEKWSDELIELVDGYESASIKA